MEYFALGGDDIRASRVGFGTWPIGGTIKSGDYGAVDDDAAASAISRALDAGINLFDTAPAYGDGRAEQILGKAIAGRRQDAVLVTKCGVHWDHRLERWITNSSLESITNSVEASLRRLRTDYLDALLIHVPDPDTTPADAMTAFDDLRSSGKVRTVGVSNFTIDQIDEYVAVGRLDVLQAGYNMFDRRSEDLLDQAASRGLLSVTYGSLCHGLFSGEWTDRTVLAPIDWRSKGDVFGLPLFTADNLAVNIEVAGALRDLAVAHGRTLPQLAAAWVLSNPHVSSALVGIRAEHEIADALEAADWRIDEEIRRSVDVLVARAAGTEGTDHYRVNELEEC